VQGKRKMNEMTPYQKSVLSYFDSKPQKQADENQDWAQGMLDLIKDIPNKKKQKILKLEISEFAIQKVKDYFANE